MGLDMYLSRKTYVKNWDHYPAEKQFKIIVKQGNKTIPVSKIDSKKISYVEEEIMYWRKANHIHKWFVDNCADGVDECQPIYVPEEKLEELYSICVEVLIESKLVSGIVKNGSTISYETGFKWKDNLQVGKVIKDYSYAEENLPTQGGFFFGSTDYDQWYYQSVKDTVETLSKYRNEDGSFDGEFYYQASW